MSFAALAFLARVLACPTLVGLRVDVFTSDWRAVVPKTRLENADSYHLNMWQKKNVYYIEREYSN